MVPLSFYRFIYLFGTPLVTPGGRGPQSPPQDTPMITDLFTFKTFPCIILSLVISYVFAYETNRVFNDFLNSCATGKAQLHGGVRFVKWVNQKPKSQQEINPSPKPDHNDNKEITVCSISKLF